MKIIKYIFVALLIMLISVIIPIYLKPENPFLMILIFIIVGFFIFNLIIRKSLSFKNYFTSNYNFFTSKIRYKKSFEISKELMFEKIIEVISNSDFKLAETDRDKFEILAISTITLKSWGENLYISFEDTGSETIMNFCSTTFFQIYSWGKNKKNYDVLLGEIESSLII